MTGFRGHDGGGRVVEDLSPQSLRGLLDHGKDFVIVCNPDWGPEYFVQALCEDHPYYVEVRSGGPDRQVGTEVPDTDAAFAIFQSWILNDGWWQGAYAWQPVRT